MKNIKHIFLAFLLSSLFSCIETAKNIDLPESEPKLVVTTFIASEDTEINLYLSWSKPLYGPASVGQIKIEKNAIVKIIDGSKEYTLSYLESKDCYQISDNLLNIIGGKEFKLSVQEPGGKTVYSSCVIPSKPEVKVDLILADTTNSQWGGVEIKKQYKISNLSTNESSKYFKFTLLKKFLYLGQTDTNYEYGYPELKMIQAGKSIIFTFYDWGQMSSDFYDEQMIVYQTDEAYYRFNNSILNSNEGDPFSEPSITYTNIENGLGVFCAYNRKVFAISK